MTLRDPLLFTKAGVTRAELITRAVTMAHEMAHQWFGNLTSPVWWDDLWLNESFAEYLGTRVAADATQYADAWVLDARTRRPWGMAADLRPTPTPWPAPRPGTPPAPCWTSTASPTPRGPRCCVS
ncbi:MAG: M1 family aminopeptidase [Nocardioides sp.]